MTDRTQVQVSRLLDERGLGPLQVRLLVWSLFIVLIDGYDISSIAFAAPSLMREWNLNQGDLGPVFSASLGGILFGSAIFGFIGDRYGRRVALIGANLLFGVFTLAAAFSTGPGQMFWLRLLAGLGIGGIIPNIVALNAECAPQNLRATLAIVAVAFVPLGGAIPGFVSAALGPAYGWQILFYIGGAVPLAVAVAAMLFGLPESVKFMALHERHHRQLGALIEELRPGFKTPDNPQFVIEGERQFDGFNPLHLFRDGLAVVTPLTWLLFALNLMGYYFLLSWTPTLLTAAKLPPADAALAGALLQVGGTAGALVLSRWLQRYHFLGLTVMFMLAVPAVASIGYAGLTSRTALLVTIFAAGFLVLGIQAGINVFGAMIYPTSLRANGSGWQLGVGRVGSIVGPLAGGLISGMPAPTLYMWSALPFAAGAAVCYAIYRLIGNRLSGDAGGPAGHPWSRGR
jgi:AAHS family 4-hydroxybenzoate transporter-like MFS transporter